MNSATAVRPRRSVPARLGDHLLTVLAAAGSVCIVLVILGWAFDISLMMFRTGSMSPTIPAGSVAVVREIPATEMEVGDVVTVDRGEGLLPVTHRVTAIDAVDSITGEVTFEMRGDANAAPDPEPYTATDVRRVMFSVPGAAHVVQWFGDPYVLGGLTLGATTLVIWAFWPRERDGPPEQSGQREQGGPREHGGPPAEQDAEDAPTPRDPTRFRAAGIPLVAALVLTAPGGGALLLTAPGDGHTETTLITGEHLRMQTTGDPEQMQNLAPGRPVSWEVGVWADAPTPGEIRLGISGRGELARLPGALLVSVQACAEPWADDRCPDGAARLLEPESLDQLSSAEPTRHLTTMPSQEQRWLRVEVTLADSSDSADAAGADGEVLIHAVGAGEELAAGPEQPPEPPGSGGTDGQDSADGEKAHGGGSDDLARTGGSAVGAVLALGLAAITLGIVLRRREVSGCGSSRGASRSRPRRNR